MKDLFKSISTACFKVVAFFILWGIIVSVAAGFIVAVDYLCDHHLFKPVEKCWKFEACENGICEEWNINDNTHFEYRSIAPQNVTKLRFRRMLCDAKDLAQ